MLVIEQTLSILDTVRSPSPPYQYFKELDDVLSTIDFSVGAIYGILLAYSDYYSKEFKGIIASSFNAWNTVLNSLVKEYDIKELESIEPFLEKLNI